MDCYDNSPSAGYIRWVGLHITYMGTTYSIPDGNTNYKYVYWLYSNPTVLMGSNSFPTLGDDDVLVFLNKNGIHATVPNTTVIDGSLIVPESIYASAIAANTITVDEMAANSIGTNQLIAGAITASKLDVLARDYVNNFSRTNDLHGWAGTSAATTLIADPTGKRGQVLKIAAAANQNIIIASDAFEIDPLQTYVARVSIANKLGADPAVNANARVYFGLTFYDSTGTELATVPFNTSSRTFGTAATNPYFFTSAAGATYTAWRDMEAYMLSADTTDPKDCPEAGNVDNHFVIPYNAKFVVIRLLNYYATAAQNVYFYGVSCNNATAGKITANQIATGTITAASGLIANLAVGTAAIQDTAITNAKIGSLAVGTAQIADSAITNAKIANASIDNAKIANLDASKITTGTLNAINITGSVITGSTLKSSNSTAYVQIDNQFVRIYQSSVQKVFLGYYTNTINGNIQPTFFMGKSIDTVNLAKGIFTMMHIEPTTGVFDSYIGVLDGTKAADGSLNMASSAVFHDNGNAEYRAMLQNTLLGSTIRVESSNGDIENVSKGRVRFFSGSNPVSTMDINQQSVDVWYESHFTTNGSYTDPWPNTAAAIKASGSIAANNLYLKDGLFRSGWSNFNWTLPNGQYMLLEQGSGATVFRGNQTRLVFHDQSPYLRIESWNGGYCDVEAHAFLSTSDRAQKKNIEPYTGDALKEINGTPIYLYNMIDEIDGVDFKSLGVVAQEVPFEVISKRSIAIDLYPMVTMAWKGIQELDSKVETKFAEMVQNYATLSQSYTDLKTKYDELSLKIA